MKKSSGSLKRPNTQKQVKPQYQFDQFSSDEKLQINQADGEQINNKAIQIKDLCPEDKLKIGQLIQRLASVKEERSQLAKELKDRTREYKKRVKSIKQQSQSAIDEQRSTEQKFRQSLGLLKEYQQRIESITRFEEEEQEEPKVMEDKENQCDQSNRQSQRLQDIGQQTELDSLNMNSNTINKQYKIENNDYQSVQRDIKGSGRKVELLVQKSGESEQKLNKLCDPNTTEFNYQNPLTKVQIIPKQKTPTELTEIQKLRQEIEEITDGLKSIDFGSNREASFSASNAKDFQSQFQQFEAKTKQINKESNETNRLGSSRAKTSLRTPKEQDTDSDSDSDDLELAKRLITLKNQRSQMKLNSQEVNYEIQPTKNLKNPQLKLGSSQKFQETKPQMSTVSKESLNSTPHKQQEIEYYDQQRFSKQLDQRLQSMLASSQSYNISLTTLTQQNEQSMGTSKKDMLITTPVDYLKSQIRKDIEKSNSMQSTPQPIPERPKIYIQQQQDNTTRCLFFQNTNQLQSQQQSEKFQDRTQQSLAQSHIDEQEIDGLIDSLNNNNRVFQKQSRSLFHPEELRPLQMKQTNFRFQGNSGFYDQNLFDVIQKIESPRNFTSKINSSKEEDQSVQQVGYSQLMEKYEQIIKDYDIGINSD